MRRFCLILGVAVAVKGASIPVTEDPTASPIPVGMSHSWRYDTQTEPTHNLPAAWGGDCNTGTKQSPIDVVSTAVSIPSPDPGMVMSHLWEMDITGDLYNTDRHITYQITQNLKPFISGGPLTSTSNYVFDHMDFHFGSTDTQGSEHTIDGTKYPMEIQLVFYDGQFSDIHVAGASANVDALATISYFVELDSTDNADMKNIVDDLSSIANPILRKKRSAKKGKKARSNIDVAKSNVVKDVKIDLSKIFGLNVEDYYYYDGSMTSPSCTENVRWIISSKKLKISSTQLAEFRALQATDLTSAGSTDDIQDNFRPVQSLGSRTVNRRMKTFQIDPVAAQVFVSSITGAAVFHNLYNYLQQPEIAKAFSENPVADFFNNIPEIFQGEQEVVQQRSAQEYQQQQQAVYQQAVYQPQQYQQYLSPPQPAPVPVQA